MKKKSNYPIQNKFLQVYRAVPLSALSYCNVPLSVHFKMHKLAFAAKTQVTHIHLSCLKSVSIAMHQCMQISSNDPDRVLCGQ